jgi:hypothetical protein
MRIRHHCDLHESDKSSTSSMFCQDIPQDIPMSGHSFLLAVIGDWRMLPRREATKICHALWGRAVVSLGIFEIVPEDRYPSREDRDRISQSLMLMGSTT